MTKTLTPDNPAQVLETVKWAVTGNMPLEIRGQGSKRGLGRPVTAGHILDMSGLSGITLYEPEELVMTAGTGTLLSEIQAILAEKRQQLAFEPLSYGALLGNAGAEQTIGGVFSCNLAGPRRIHSGAARDHLLGFHAVNGRGEEFKSGGRVVKNVTGFDLSKLISGSFGTLAVMTEVSFKVLPAPEKSRTALVMGLSDADAAKAMSAALGSPYEVSAAAHLPADMAVKSSVSYVAGAGASVTAIRVEGPGASVDSRVASLRDLLSAFGPVEELHTANTATLWREIRDGVYLADEPDRQIWRISTAPVEGHKVVAAISRDLGHQAYYDHGGGLVWISIPAQADGAAAIVRGALSGNGHATLIRASDEVRSIIPVFQPQPGPLAALNARVKEAFDPEGIFNPGRMTAG